MKLCWDCFWYTPSDILEHSRYAICGCPKQEQEQDFVQGGMKYRWPYCDLQRKEYGVGVRSCGPKARWFEPKEKT